jgi:hypothetical protein
VAGDETIRDEIVGNGELPAGLVRLKFVKPAVWRPNSRVGRLYDLRLKTAMLLLDEEVLHITGRMKDLIIG